MLEAPHPPLVIFSGHTTATSGRRSKWWTSFCCGLLIIISPQILCSVESCGQRVPFGTRNPLLLLASQSQSRCRFHAFRLPRHMHRILFVCSMPARSRALRCWLARSLLQDGNGTRASSPNRQMGFCGAYFLAPLIPAASSRPSAVSRSLLFCSSLYAAPTGSSYSYQIKPVRRGRRKFRCARMGASKLQTIPVKLATPVQGPLVLFK